MVSVEVDVEAGSVAVPESKVIKPETLAETVTAIGYGGSIVKVMSTEEYKAMTGRKVLPQTAKPAGCGCCNKNKN